MSESNYFAVIEDCQAWERVRRASGLALGSLSSERTPAEVADEIAEALTTDSPAEHGALLKELRNSKPQSYFLMHYALINPLLARQLPDDVVDAINEGGKPPVSFVSEARGQSLGREL